MRKEKVKVKIRLMMQPNELNDLPI